MAAVVKATNGNGKTNIVPGTHVPAEMLDAIKKDAGKGISTAASDNIIPILYVLHPLSPQCSKKSQAFIPGAEPGFIWLKNASQPIINGEEGVVAIPVLFGKELVEWVPRDSGGGFVGRTPIQQFENGEWEEAGAVAKRLGAKETRDPRTKQPIWTMESGNELIETRFFICQLYRSPGQPLPYFIPFTSTGHVVARTWMTTLNGKRIPGVEGPPAIFASAFRLTTIHRSNAMGEWYQLEVTDLGLLWDPDVVKLIGDPNLAYRRAGELLEGFSTGKKQVETPEARGGDGGEGSAAHSPSPI